MSIVIEEIQTHWAAIGPLLSIHDEGEYDLAVERLNSLLNEVGDNEGHPLYDLLDTLGTIIHAYEEVHHPMPESSGPEMLRFFMAEHGLADADFPELGSPEAVPDILHGKRELTAREIRLLAERFHVSPAVFV